MTPSEAAQRFALALPGIWLHHNQASTQHLGGRPAGPANRRWARGLLKDSWGVTDAATAIERMNWLASTGHTAEYFEWRARYAGLPESERESDLRLIFVKLFGAEVGDTGLVAWDQVRRINVAGWSFLAGYLTEEEAWAQILPAARVCQQTYGSWEALGRGYLLGTAYWGPAHLERHQPACEALLSDPKSAWRTIPWSTPLGAGATVEDGGGSSMGLVIKAVAGLVAAAVVLVVCAGVVGVGVVGAGGAMLTLNRTSAPSAVASDWDGVAPFVCKGNQSPTISGITARFVEGTAITAEGNCKLTVIDSDIEAPTALHGKGNARITVQGGRLAGRDHAILADNNAQVAISGAQIDGKTTKKAGGKIDGP